MAGHSDVDESQFKGLSKQFNTFTNRGRKNISVATLSVMAGVGAIFYLKSKFSAKKK